MNLLFALHIVLTCLALVSTQYNAIAFYCGRDTYGSPSPLDCRLLLESFAGFRDNVARAFDEEQLRKSRDGSWPGIGGIVDVSQLSEMVQLPRFYTLSESIHFGTCSFLGGDPAC